MLTKLLIHLVYLLYSKLIIFEIIVRSNLFANIKLLYSGWNGGFGFGDHVSFCVNIKSKVKRNSKIFCYSIQQFETAQFFYEKEYLIKSIFSIPKFLSTSIIGLYFLGNNKNFKPYKLMSAHNKKLNLTLNYGTAKQIKHIRNRIKKFQITERLKILLENKTIAIAIKNYSYNKKKNSDINFQKRQTRNLNKIYKLIHVISNKNIKVILLGKNTNYFVKLVSDKKLIDNKKIFLFDDLSNNYSIADQVYLAENTVGFAGNGSGDMIFFDTLRKKILLFDYYRVENANLYLKNRTCLYKKILNKKNKKKEIFDWLKVYNSKDHKLIENSYNEIYKVAKNKFNI